MFSLKDSLFKRKSSLNKSLLVKANLLFHIFYFKQELSFQTGAVISKNFIFFIEKKSICKGNSYFKRNGSFETITTLTKALLCKGNWHFKGNRT